MTDRLDLPLHYRKELEALLREHVPNIEVWAYGSRVNGASHDGSDLGLVLRSPSLEPMVYEYTELVKALEQSNISILVQVHDWAQLPESFHREIERDYVVLQRGQNHRQSEERSKAALGDVCTKIGSGATPRGGKDVYLDDGPYTLIRSQNVYNDGFHRDGLVSIGEDHANDLQNVEVFEEDVLLNITGDSVARVCQVSPDVLPARVNQHVTIIRPDSINLDAGYLRYYLASPEMQAMLLSWAGSGGTRNALTKRMIEALEILLPPLPEQRRIAHILGTLDDKIELNRRMNETLEATARTIFHDWFVDFGPVRAKLEGQEPYLPPELWALFPDRLVDSELGEIPEAWEVETLGDLCERPQYGYTASAQSDSIGPKFLRITDINKIPWIEWAKVPYCVASAQDRAKFRVRKGDLLIARMADPGHGVMVEEDLDAVFASYLIRFRPRNAIHGRLLQYWLRSAGYWDLVQSRGAGTTRISLNAKVLSGFPVIVPTSLLAECFTDTVHSIRNRVVANVAEMEGMAAQRDALLPKLVSDELRTGGFP